MTEYLTNYSIKIYKDKDQVEECGTILYTTFGRVPSNNINEYIWNLDISGYLEPRVLKYYFYIDLSNQNSEKLVFKNPVQGNFIICKKTLNVQNFIKIEYSESRKELVLILDTGKWDFSIRNKTIFFSSLSLNNNTNEDNKKCSIEHLSEETNGFTEINGSRPPGELKTLVDSHTLLKTKNVYGDWVLMIKSIRKAGTRVGIHVHKYGGYTLILKGTMTDFVQGQENKTYSNSGYYMPPCSPMAAANLGEEDVELIDIFIGPPGEPFIEVLEPEWPFERVLRFPDE